jgi:hypothetical protein
VCKDKVARLKVICQEGVLILAFKLVCRGKARLEDVVSNGGKVIVMQLKLSGMGHNKVGSQEWLCEVWDKESGEHDVKWEKGLDPMHHVRW